MKLKPVALGVALALASYVAVAAISLQLSPNYDDTEDSKYEAGDKPEPGVTCSTWTCTPLGAAVGEVDEVSATELAFAASGADDLDNVVLAHKPFASGDAEVIAVVPDQADRTGYGENFTGYGVRCQEGVATGAYFCQVWSPNINDIPRFKCGTASANNSQQGDPATALPEYVGMTYDDSASEFKGWQSNNGTTWTQIGVAVSRDAASSMVCGAFGTSQQAGETSFATLTEVTAEATITIETPATPASFTAGPTAGSPSVSTLQALFTSSQDGTVRGTACANGNAGNAAQTLAGNCAAGVAVATIAEAVTANVSDSGTFTGLSASTTYDLGFVIDATVDSSLASLADQVTDDDAPPPGGGTCIAPFATPNNSVIGTGNSRTADISTGGASHTGCRDGDDTVLGWDMSMPAETVIASNGGIFGGGSVPAYFKGNWLNHCRVQWDEVEPSNDNADPDVTNAAAFDWDTVDDCFDAVGTGSGAARLDGAEIHVRGVVVRIEACGGPPGPADGTAILQEQWTAPSWAAAITGTERMGCHQNSNGFDIIALNLDNNTVRDEYREFIRAFAARYADRGHYLVMHLKSASQGEECCNNTEPLSMTEIIDEWVAGYGPANVGKLAWLKDDPAEVFTHAVFDNNTGMRGGIGEKWMRVQYTPGVNNGAFTGQRRDALGYFTVDYDFEPIRDGRHWMEEIEFTTQSDDDYLGALFRSSQMRRNQMWVPSSFSINPRMDAWLGTELGQTPTSTAQGWSWLIETRSPPGSSPRAFKNMERHVMQRETLGATSVTNKAPWDNDVTGQTTSFPDNDAACNFGGNTLCRAMTWSRREANAQNIIGFALEDAYWPTSLTHDAVVKVTYLSTSGTQNRTVEVRNAAGTMRDSFDTSGSDGGVRTATMFIDDFTAPASGESKDFELYFPDGEVDVMFVRIIKNGGSFAVW